MSETLKPEIFTFEQGSKEWFAARMGIPTASQFSAILSSGKTAGSASKTRRTYMMKLIGELLTGLPMENFTNEHMARGKAMEAEARNTYALARDVWPDQVGFIRRGRVGCSPDSLIDDDGMIEIKTKLSHLQLEVLLEGKVPNEHIAQCQGQLWIAERSWLDFISHWSNLPQMVVRVERDEAFIAKLDKEVKLFLEEMDELIVKFEKLGCEKRPPHIPDVIDGLDVVKEE